MPETKRSLKVFLCHASQDKPIVRELARRLFAEGWIDPWLDEKKLLPGQDWRLKIEEAVETSDIVIICLSSNSITKEGFVQKELRYAREIALEKPEETIFLIPLRLDNCETPRGLRFYQWVDYFGEKKDEAYSALVESLKLRYEQKLILEEQERIQKEKVKQEIVERIAREKAEREKEEREKAEKAAQEKLQREAAEKARREEVERKAAEKAVREEAKHDAAERSKREWTERRVAQIAKLKETLLKAMPFIRITAVVGIVAILFWVGSWAMPQFLSPVQTITVTGAESLISPSDSPVGITISTATHTLEPSLAPTDTLVPTRTLIPTLTLTLTPTLSPTPLPTQMTDAQGVEMVLVPQGIFKMGGNADEALAKCQKISSLCERSMFENEEPPHDVYLDAFYIDKYEVTNKLFKICVDAGICSPPTRTQLRYRTVYYGNSEFDDYPVNYVDWNVAKTYCEWRRARLPTEAEWEKAARGTDGRTYPWGELFSCYNANYGSCLGNTTKVGIYETGKSPYGAYDMTGNVWEWVTDWYSETYYQISPASNPLGPSRGERRVLRGGAYITYSGAMANGRTSSRGSYPPTNDSDVIGFRCARDTNP